jgi:hypothetical protein
MVGDCQIDKTNKVRGGARGKVDKFERIKKEIGGEIGRRRQNGRR